MGSSIGANTAPMASISAGYAYFTQANLGRCNQRSINLVPAQNNSAHGRVRALRCNDDTHRGRLMSGEGPGEMLQRLPIVIGPDADQKYVHGAFATQAQPPHEVIAAAHVISDEPRRPGFDHRTRVLAEVPLQAAAREQARRIAIRGDQHQGAGLAVSGARCLHEQTEGNRASRGALAFEQGKQGTE